ncbi:MAG: hypothetical protein AAFW76_10490 [Pseudomonadota bacterium]
MPLDRRHPMDLRGVDGALINPGAEHRGTPEPIFPAGIASVVDMLQATAATGSEMRTGWLYSFRTGFDDPKQPTGLPSPTVLDLNLNQIPWGRVRHRERIWIAGCKAVAQPA